MNGDVYFYLQVAFWALVFLLALCYGIFPVTLPFVSELFKRRHRDIDENFELPTVSLLISAYNEEGVIERKIHNILEIDYPKEKLEVLIGDDGSSLSGTGRLTILSLSFAGDTSTCSLVPSSFSFSSNFASS